MPVFFAEQKMQVTSYRLKSMAASVEDPEAKAVFKTMSDVLSAQMTTAIVPTTSAVPTISNREVATSSYTSDKLN